MNEKQRKAAPDRPIPGSDVSAGAVPFSRLFDAVPEGQTFQDVLLLFDAGITAHLRNELRRAGFPEYPARMTDPEREALAASYTGAAPSCFDHKHADASLAFTLAAMSKAEFALQRAIAMDDAGEVFRQGLLMGRISEWWRWRSAGHDTAAVHGRRFPAGRTDKATEKHQAKAQQRRQMVLRLARAKVNEPGGRLHNGRPNAKALARLCAKHPDLCPVGFDAAWRIIREAVKQEKLQ